MKRRIVVKNTGEEGEKNDTRMAFSRLVYPIILRFSHYPVVSPLRGRNLLYSLPLSLSVPLSFPLPFPVLDDVFVYPSRSRRGREEERGREGSLPRCATGVDEIQVLLG